MTSKKRSKDVSPVALAEERLEEARAHLSELEQRLRSGEADITPADLAEATAEAHHAELAIQGARTVEARRRDGERREQATRLWEEWVQTMDETTAPIGAAIEAISKGVTQLVEAAQAHSAEWQRYATRVSQLHFGEDPASRPPEVAQFYGGTNFGSVGPARVEGELPVLKLIEATVVDSLRRSSHSLQPVEAKRLLELAPAPAPAALSSLLAVRKHFRDDVDVDVRSNPLRSVTAAG